MTTYYQPMEIQSGENAGKWHMCSYTGSREPMPIGYCSPFEECPSCRGHSLHTGQPACEACDNHGVIRKENPCPGHDTPEAAQEHYDDYLLDFRCSYDGREDQVFRPCLECGGLTEHRARLNELPYFELPLCEKHSTKENVKKHWPQQPNSS